jgi:ribosomal protein S6--L-glutamate ligase
MIARDGSPTRIWILTDRYYLPQRMPRALTQCLVDRGHRVRVIIVDDGAQVSLLAADGEKLSVWAGLTREDVVIVRSRHPFALALLAEAESVGARTVLASAAIHAVRDKVRALLTLERHGLPTPETFLACRPEDLVRRRPRFPLLLKPLQGDSAQAIRLVRTSRELADVEWTEPIVLAQRYVKSGGLDLKLYLAGRRVWGVRRPFLRVGDPAATHVHVDAGLASLARDCAGAFGLPLLGVDVVETADGPVIVDVNDFPNYTGIDEAPEVIAEFLVAWAHDEPAAPAWVGERRYGGQVTVPK